MNADDSLCSQNKGKVGKNIFEEVKTNGRRRSKRSKR